MKRLVAVATAVMAGLALWAAPAGAWDDPPAPKNQPSLSISSPQDFFFCCTQPNAHQIIVKNVGGSATGALAVTLTFAPDSLGEAFAITSDGCTGRSLGPGKKCVIEVTWLVGSDTRATLSVASRRVQASVQLVGVAVP